MQPESQLLKRRIPWMMTGMRAVLGPVLMIAELSGFGGATLAWMVLTALLSDIFDGVLARRWNCDTAAVRLFDSMADILFYICCAAALWLSRPQLTRSFVVPIALIISLEALKFVFDFVKFGKPTSYHSWLAKTWGLILAITVVMSFATHQMLALQIAWWIAVAVGILYCFEGLAISLLMPEWRHDLKTLWHAWKIRRQILADRDNARFARLIDTVVVTMFILIAATAHAASIPSVTFIGGTVPGVATGTTGTLDTGTDQIEFIFYRTGTSLAIPYAQIQNFSYREKSAMSVGVVPSLLFIGFLHPELRRHILSITYLDPSGSKQVAIFEVPKQARDTLPVILQERAGVCADQYQLPCHTNIPSKPLIHSSSLR